VRFVAPSPGNYDLACFRVGPKGFAVKPIPLNDAASHEKALEEMLERVLNHQATWPEFIALHNKRSAEVVRQIERRKGLS
jgi:hypothetical protein